MSSFVSQDSWSASQAIPVTQKEQNIPVLVIYPLGPRVGSGMYVPTCQGLQDIIPYRCETRRVVRPVIKREQHLDITANANRHTPIGLAELLWVDEVAFYPRQVQVGALNGDNAPWLASGRGDLAR